MLETTIETTGQQARILIIADHTPTRLTLGKLMRRAGAQVITARDTDEGLNYLLTQRFNVLLMDLRLPTGNSFELLRHYAMLPLVNRPARVIAISGEYETGVILGQPVEIYPHPSGIDSLLEMIRGKLN